MQEAVQVAQAAGFQQAVARAHYLAGNFLQALHCAIHATSTPGAHPCSPRPHPWAPSLLTLQDDLSRAFLQLVCLCRPSEMLPKQPTPVICPVGWMEPCQGHLACFAPLGQMSLRFPDECTARLTLFRPTYLFILSAYASSRIHS